MITLSPRDQKNIDDLHDAIREMESAQNRVSINEFYQFADLFRADRSHLTEKRVFDLSIKFFLRFNPYRPIEVTQNDEVIFRVPQLFIPIKTISEEYGAILNNFRENGSSPIPKYASEATAGLTAAIIKSQENIENEGYESYGEYIQALSQEYANDIRHFNELKNESAEAASTDERVESIPVSIRSIVSLDNSGLVWK